MSEHDEKEEGGVKMRKKTKEVLCMSCFDRLEIRKTNWIRYSVKVDSGDFFSIYMLGDTRRCIPCLKRAMTFGEVTLANPA